MCNCKIIAKKGDVLIFRGSRCECLNVVLPNVNIHLDKDGFEDFFGYVGSKLSGSNKIDERVFIDTPCQGIYLHFTEKELTNLFDVLLDAKLQLELAEAYEED